jgi:hypothetical protein
MAQNNNPFLPGYVPPAFNIPSTPGDGSPGSLSPVLLGGIGGAAPVRNTTPQNISDFYGGVTTIGQPDAGYFDQFTLPGDNRAYVSSSLPVAAATDVVDTRTDYSDPEIYAEILGQLQGILNTGGASAADVNEAMNDVVSGGTSEGGNTGGGNTGGGNTADTYTDAYDTYTPYDPVIDGSTIMYDDSNILNQLADLQAMQEMFLTADDIAPTIQYDDAILKNQMLDLEDRITNLQIPEQTFQQFDPTNLQNQINQLAMAEPLDTSQFLTAADLPTYQQFDPTQLQTQIDELAMAQPMDTSQFLTAADLPTYDTSQFLTSADLPSYQQFDPSGLQSQIAALQNQPAVDTSQFLTSADLPTYQQFDPTALQQEISNLQTQVGLLNETPTVDTSQFLTAADLPAAAQFDPSGLQAQIDELTKLYAGNTGGFAAPPSNFRIS